MKTLLLSMTFWVIVVSAVGAQTLLPSATPSPRQLTPKLRNIATEIVEAENLIRSNHFSGNRFTYEQLTTASLSYLLRGLDPHSEYLDTNAAEAFKSRMNAQYFGVGLAMQEVFDAKGIILGSYVREVFEGGPAHRAGLRFGDELIEISNVSVKAKGYDEIIPLLIGKPGTKVSVTIDRNGESRSFEFVRAAIPTPAISDAYMIRPGVGYIAMRSMITLTAHDEFRAALSRLRAAGMTALILDVRNNIGGVSRQACRIVSEFVPGSQLIFKFNGRTADGANDCISENATPDQTTPIVVLVNRDTVSATEFLAAGFQDSDRALLVGETTFGKGLAQTAFQLDSGPRLHLTTSRFLTVTGRMTQRNYSQGQYRYFDGGSLPSPSKEKPEFRTRSGRIQYGGEGIVPDELVLLGNDQAYMRSLGDQLSSPIFAFVLEVRSGRVASGLSYKMDRPADLRFEPTGNEFQNSAELFAAFRNFAKENFKTDLTVLDGDRVIVERLIRNELMVAAFGSRSAVRLTNENDTQLRRALELVPKAKTLLKHPLSAPKTSR